ncbi:MAG: bifunctional 4-hydroxy-2-oxoglutarate aldolase/2-dehydro-3-deoxy-phosphogluconate aldolase [Longicatena sp.]
MYKTLQRLDEIKAMAIVRVETAQRAYEIADGLIDGGIPCMEISFTLPNAAEVIKALKDKYKDTLLVGAGTVLDSETARLAILAGAQFIIAPNFAPEVAKTCNRYRIPYMPGCTSVTEMVQAMEAGASMIKAFPISNFYGKDLVKVLKTPLPYMPIMASGGVTLETIQDWISAGVDCIGFGGLLTKGTSAGIASNAKAIRKELDK